MTMPNVGAGMPGQPRPAGGLLSGALHLRRMGGGMPPMPDQGGGPMAQPPAPGGAMMPAPRMGGGLLGRVLQQRRSGPAY